MFSTESITSLMLISSRNRQRLYPVVLAFLTTFVYIFVFSYLESRNGSNGLDTLVNYLGATAAKMRMELWTAEWRTPHSRLICSASCYGQLSPNGIRRQ
jgi:hypothetical protein